MSIEVVRGVHTVVQLRLQQRSSSSHFAGIKLARAPVAQKTFLVPQFAYESVRLGPNAGRSLTILHAVDIENVSSLESLHAPAQKSYPRQGLSEH